MQGSGFRVQGTESKARRAILRISTAGSVDDGKSSLIGRLLYDTKSIFEDQLSAIERASERRGSDRVELALLTDGLRAEREQNITIDVAYRYFSTLGRKFIIADTPGHEQYTRNMVTGTSTSDLSIILIDARKGVLDQSRRHAAISALLGVPQAVVAINKMDLVDYSREVFEEIVREFEEAAPRLGYGDPGESLRFIPISALYGHNVVQRSSAMPWYEGPSLLEFLEVAEPRTSVSRPLRFPVQYVIRPDQDFRGLAGRVEGGSVSIGDRVRILPSGHEARVAEVLGPSGKADLVSEGDSAVVLLDRHLDVSRGEMLVDPDSPPEIADQFEAMVCWMAETPLRAGNTYTILHSQRAVRCHIQSVQSRLDITSVRHERADDLKLNDLGRAVFRVSQPLALDPYGANRATGAFAIVDSATNVTIGAGMVERIVIDNRDRPAEREIFQVSGRHGPRSEAVEELRRLLRARGEFPLVLEESVVGAIAENSNPEDLAGYLAEQGATPILVIDGEELTLARRPVTMSTWTTSPLKGVADLTSAFPDVWHPDI